MTSMTNCFEPPDDKFAVFRPFMKYRSARRDEDRPSHSNGWPGMDLCEYGRPWAALPVQADPDTEIHFGPVRDTNEILPLGEKDGECSHTVWLF
jgi:hypothetical protein